MGGSCDSASPVQKLRTGQTDQQDGRAGRQQSRVFDQVEERVLRPLDVVEHDYERAVGSRAFERRDQQRFQSSTDPIP